MFQLQFPLKLYGREAQIRECSKAFSLVSEQKTPHMIIITGDAGVGKSAMLNQAQAELGKQDVFCISGKSDQYQQDTPYFAIGSAFRSLVRQIENDDIKQDQWQKRLLAAIGNNGRTIIDVIPDAERIIGPQPPMPEIESGKAQNRFNLTFQNFVRACCSGEHPLILFLDDLQWIDSGSLKLIELAMTDDQCRLLMLGAYRSKEVESTHPLAATIESLESAGVNIQRLHLDPLSSRHVSQFVADTLQMKQTRPLARLMFQQTAGNPLFLKRLFQYLCLQDWLTQNRDSGLWSWQVEHLPQQDLAELITQSLAQLPIQTQHLLKQAACIGRVPLKTLAAISKISISKTLQLLEAALEIQLIILDREDPELMIRFPHNRIQQIVYDSIQLPARTAIHLAIGRSLQTTVEENLFTAVNQLNLGSSLLTQVEKSDLAKLNLRAAQQAKSVTAFELTSIYVYRALELAGTWEINYDLILRLYQEAIEVEFLNGNFEQSHTLADKTLTYTTGTDRISVYQLKIQAYVAQCQFSVAIDLGISTLEEFGIDPQAAPLNIDVTALESLSESDDEIGIIGLKILNTISNVALIVAPHRIPSMVFAEIALLARIGNSFYSAIIVSDYAYLLCASGEIDEGFEYSELALRLLKKFDHPSKYKVLNALNCSIRLWKLPLSTTLEPLQTAIALALESGDPESVGYASLNFCNHTFFSNEKLQKVETEYKKHNELFDRLGLGFASQANAIIDQAIASIINVDSPRRIDSGLLNRFREFGILNCLLFAYSIDGLLAYLFGDYKASVGSLSEAEKYLESGSGFIITAVHNFYYSLALLAIYPNTPIEEQVNLLAKVEQNQAQMRIWADHCPANFEHKWQLVEAEKCALFGYDTTALDHYDRAINGAQENEYIQEEALANERLAKFYFARDQQEPGSEHYKRAIALYKKWGAVAKVNDLEEKNPAKPTDIVFSVPSMGIPDSPLLNCDFKTEKGNFIIDCPNSDIAVELIDQRNKIASMLSSFPQLNNFRFRVKGKDYSAIYNLKPKNITRGFLPMISPNLSLR